MKEYIRLKYFTIYHFQIGKQLIKVNKQINKWKSLGKIDFLYLFEEKIKQIYFDDNKVNVGRDKKKKIIIY